MNDFPDALFKIDAVSNISTINVDCPIPMLSEAPTRENILSIMPILASAAGTNNPVCAKIAIRAFCLKKVDFPAIFGPVISHTCLLFKLQSFGIKSLLVMFCKYSITGCLPSFMKNLLLLVIFGLI